MAHIRGHQSQASFATQVGIHKNTLGTYERGEREPTALALMGYLALGWNTNWVLSGEGPERLDALQQQASTATDAATASASQALRQEELTLAVQLAEEALDGGKLEPADYARLVFLIHDALVNGLPSAQVLAFARPASRGIGVEHGGKDVARRGKAASR